MTEYSFFREQETARRTAKMHAENKGRPAMTKVVFTTTGVGSVQFEDCADFDCTYIEEPVFSHGAVIDFDGWEQLLEDENYQAQDGEGGSPTPLPTVSGFVTQWEQDDNGFYVGAWCAARVMFTYDHPDPVTGLDPFEQIISQHLQMPEIQHHFRFEGVAIKGGEDPGDDAPGGGGSSG